MVEKAIIYDIETGSIERILSGSIDLERERIGNNEGVITDEDTEIPNSDLRSKMVDTSNGEIVNDPEYEQPTTKRDIKEDIKEELSDGKITEKEALERLLEL